MDKIQSIDTLMGEVIKSVGYCRVGLNKEFLGHIEFSIEGLKKLKKLIDNPGVEFKYIEKIDRTINYLEMILNTYKDTP